MKLGHKQVFFILTLLSVFLFGKNDVLFAQVVINEIGAYAPTNEEWIELLNIGTDPVDLTDWKFWEDGRNHGLATTTNGNFTLLPNAYAIIVQQEEGFRRTHPAFSGTLFDSSWGTLNEGGEIIGIKDSTGLFIEQFTYISAPNHSLERKTASLTDYSGTNWHEHATSDSAGLPNSEPTVEESATEETTETITPSPTSTITEDMQALQHLRISEFLSYPLSGETEWIEIENTSDTSIDLRSIRIKDGVSTLVTGTTTLPAHTFFVFVISGSKLNNSGDTIILETVDGTLLDQITYGNFDDGTMSLNLPAPIQNTSLAFINTTWQQTTPTRGSVNSAPEQATTQQTQNQSPTPQLSQSAPTQPSTNIRPGDIIISEFVSDPTDGEGEFVELQNRSGQPVDITGWYIEEGSKAKTILTGTIRSMEFFVVEKPKGGLNNASDVIILFTKDQKEIDRVAYGTWNDGNTADNATTPTDPMSAAREDGRDTGFDKDDWQNTTIVTKGGANRFEKEVSTRTAQIGESIDGLVINELYPNPPGSDEGEFIELYHGGKTHVRLAGWSIRDESLRTFPLEDIVLYPNKYLLLPKSVTGISLNNTTDVVELLNPEKKVVSRVSYDHVPEGESYNRAPNGTWAWSTTPTPEKENVVKEKNRAPVAVIESLPEAFVGVAHSFDASDSSDPEHDPLSFEWTFSDGKKITGTTASYTFPKIGTSTVTLGIKDTNGNSSKTTIDISVRKREEHVLQELSEETNQSEEAHILLSELIPNPVGSDESEFIELVNSDPEDADISGWQVVDAGGKIYTIPEQTSITANGFFVILRSKSGIALNNTTDTITLKNNEGSTVDQVTYVNAKEGLVYARKNASAWSWSKIATPGKENSITPPLVVAGQVGQTAAKNVSFEEVEELPKGRSVTVVGQVLVLPNTWSTQMFTILEKETRQVLPIFLSSKQFPPLTIGDEVRVVGITSEASNVKRVNAKRTSDIVVTGHTDISINEVSSLENIGEKKNIFVTVTGTVTDVSAKGFSIENGDELLVKFRGTLLKNAPKISLEDAVQVAGVLVSGDELTLTPRDENDIVILQENRDASNNSSADTSSQPFPTKEAATGAGVGATILAALGRARLLLFVKGVKRIAVATLGKFLPPRA